MKVPKDISQLGNKAKSICILSQKNYQLPGTFIYESFYSPQKELLVFLELYQEYIIRPSVIGEDSESRSYAGKYNSIGPISGKEVSIFLSQNQTEIRHKFGIEKGEVLGSIIIQEFMRSDTYGVYFSKSPQNILQQGGYEISHTHDGITKGDNKSNKRLSFSQKYELQKIGKNITSLFGCPQDIEFCIKENTLVVLQSRPITTGNHTQLTFYELQSISGVYSDIDNGEFPYIKYFSVSLLSGLISPLHLGNSIYAKYKKQKNIDPLLHRFTQLYRKYIYIKKYSVILQRVLFWQNIDHKVLKEVFQSYKYSFDIFQKSLIKSPLYFTKRKGEMNLKTRIFLIQESYKNSAFHELENIKNHIRKKNTFGEDVHYLTFTELYNAQLIHENIIQSRKHISQSYICKKRLIILRKGKVIFPLSLEGKNDDKLWIYQGDMKGKIQKKRKFQKGNILFITNIGEDITSYINHVSGVIIQSGSIYSHNAILLREYKIPSYISTTVTEELVQNTAK